MRTMSGSRLRSRRFSLAARCPRRSGARREASRRPAALLLLRTPLSDSGRARGRVPRSIQRGRRAARSVGVRRRAPMRSDREEAVLPRAAGLGRAVLRHARLRPALRLLPELVHLAVDPRPRTPSARRGTSSRRISPTSPSEPGAPTVVSTYNEPLITSEWAVAIFREAKRRGLHTAYVSNGNGTPQVLDYIRPWVDFYKVDLKSMDDKHYRQLGGVLDNVLDTIRGHPRARHLARGPDSRDSGVQRFGGRAAARGGVRRVGLARHSLARDRVPSRLQDDRSRRDSRRDSSSERPRSARKRAFATSTPATCPAASGSGRTRAVPTCAATVIERWGFEVLANRLDRRRLSRLRDADSRPMGSKARGDDPDPRNTAAGGLERRT